MAADDTASRASDMGFLNFDMDVTQLESPDPRMIEAFSYDPGEAGGAVPVPSNGVALVEASSATPAPAINASPTPEDALKTFASAELDKTNMGPFFTSVHEEGTTVTPARLLAAVQNAAKCQVNPGANITTGPDVFHIVGSPPQASKTAFTMQLCLTDAIFHRMPSVVVVMNKKTELDRMERNLNHSSDYFAKYCKAIATSATPGTRAIYPTLGNDRIKEYERCLKRWHQGDSDECPIYFLLFNDNKLKLLATVIGVVGNIVGVDANGRVRLAFRHDEGDQMSKTCNRSSVSEKSLMGAAVVANGLLDTLSSLTFVTSTLPSMTLAPVPLGNRRPIFTELEPSTNYVGYEESNRTGLQNTIVRLEMDSPSEYIKFVSEQVGAHGGMIFIGGSTKYGVDKGRKERAQAAAIEFKTTPGWCMITWSSDELHVFAADPVLIAVFQGATVAFREEPVFDPETHEDTGVIYFYYDGRHGKSEISDYPMLISFLIEGLPPNYLKTILFAKEMADRGTSICSTDHEHHLGSLYASFSKNSSCEYIRQVAGRLPQMIMLQLGLVVKIYLCATAATHETHKRAVRNCTYASDYLQKHFNEGTASLDGTLEDFCDKVDASQCDSVQDETSGAMIFAKSTVSRGTLSTKSKRKVKQVEKAAKNRRVKIHHTYPFGAQEEAADIPVQQNTGSPGVQAMGQEEAAAPMAVQNEDPPVVQSPVQEKVADIPVQQNAGPPGVRSMGQEEAAGPVVDPPVVQPPVQEFDSVFPPPLQIGARPWPLPPLPPLSHLLLTPTSPGRTDPQVEQNDAVPLVLPPFPPPSPLIILENLRDFIGIIMSALEDADEDSRMDGVCVHKMAREIQAKALYYGTMGTNVPAVEVVKYVWQNASNELAKAKVVFVANGQGGDVFKKI